MALLEIAVIAAIIIFAVIAIKFVMGIARVLATIGVILLIGALAFHFAGEGMGPTMATVKDSAQKTVQTVNQTTNEAMDFVIKVPPKSKKT